ncbi:MAG TPA: histidine kinase [Anaeromyxobacter sp.]|nr:histidine kinase [Anaeromyxobacter sp.]
MIGAQRQGTQAQRATCQEHWRLHRAIPAVLVIDAVIAGFLWAVTGWEFRATLIHSQAIGLSTLCAYYVESRWLLRNAPEWVIATTAILAGSAVGTLVGEAATGTSPLRLVEAGYTLPGLAAAVVFSLLVTLGFLSWGRMQADRATVREEQLRRASAGRALAEAELKLLQAQIEPHFLFNTLAHVIQLVDGDPARAKRMLLNLTSYLRGSLRRTRSGATTLGEELDLVRAYLEIQAVRMGERLRFTLECPAALRDHPLSPLLLQPIVENALRHGLEPKPDGGSIAVTAGREGGALVLEVRDDGVGIDPHRPPGVGLANVRERVRAISGGAGGVTLRPVEPSGLCVRIALPWDAAAAPEASPAAAAAAEGPP